MALQRQTMPGDLDLDDDLSLDLGPAARPPMHAGGPGPGSIPFGVGAQGPGTVDLRQIAIPLSVLALVPGDVARDKLVLPLSAEGDLLALAMADPTERQIVDELEFTTGRRAVVYQAVHGMLRDVIEAAYAAHAAGAAFYRGPLAKEPEASRVGSGAFAPWSGGGATAPSTPTALGIAPVLRGPASGPSSGAFPETASVGFGAPGGPLDRKPGIAPTTGLKDAPPTYGFAMAPPELTEATRTEGFPLRAPSIPLSPQRRTVLVVDDSEDIRRLLVRVFREQDYEVVESSTGLDALQKVRDCAPSVIVLDAMLPEVHGFDLCRRIKGSRRYGHIPVVLMSAVYRGWRFAEDLRRSYGVDEFLEKPFRIGEIVSAVERALRGQSRSQAVEEPEPEGDAAEHLRAGIDAYGRGDFDTARDQFKKGIGVDPLAFRLHYHLGLLYGKQENVFEAIQALEAAADLRPRDFSTLKNLAVLYQRAGFRLQATEMWERALVCAPDEDTRASIRTHLMSLL